VAPSRPSRAHRPAATSGSGGERCSQNSQKSWLLARGRRRLAQAGWRTPTTIGPTLALARRRSGRSGPCWYAVGNPPRAAAGSNAGGASSLWRQPRRKSRSQARRSVPPTSPIVHRRSTMATIYGTKFALDHARRSGARGLFSAREFHSAPFHPSLRTAHDPSCCSSYGSVRG